MLEPFDSHDPAPLNTNCRHFRWDRPCAPHKAEAATCPTCPHHDPVQHRLLIVKLAAVGDVLRTTSFLPGIRRKYPGAWITWVTAAPAVSLFDGNSLVDEVWTADDPRLRVLAFDTVLCPDADPQAAAVAASVTAQDRVGYSMTADGRVWSTNPAAQHWLHMGVDDARKKANTETYQRLVAAVLGLDPADIAEPILLPSVDDTARAQAFLDEHGLTAPRVGINTGAGSRWERKRWPVEHQRALIRQLCQAGVAVLLLGGPEEQGTHASLIPENENAAVASAGTGHSYRQFAAFVEQCDALVTGDTLALHVACARKVPVVALFGPTSVAEIELYGRGEKLAATDLDCLGCYRPTCTVSPHCQERIAPDRVFVALQRILGR